MGLPRRHAGFWPGKKARGPGLGAAESNRLWRESCLAALPPSKLTVFGDEAWRGILSGREAEAPLDLRPPLDYYTRLAPVYQAASFSLNLNSLLLPAGLSQRIFDVWAAGGFCLTDSSPGLALFPEELTRPVAFSRPEEIPDLMDRFQAHPAQKLELQNAWREHIVQNHSYASRLGNLFGNIAG